MIDGAALVKPQSPHDFTSQEVVASKVRTCLVNVSWLIKFEILSKLYYEIRTMPLPWIIHRSGAYSKELTVRSQVVLPWWRQDKSSQT